MSISIWILAFIAVLNFGGVAADALVPATAKQHLWNPRWPPHAKFHNAQTMLMGVLSGGMALVLLFGTGPLTRGRLLLAAAVATNYFVAMLLAPLLPGTGWTDPEFVAETGRPLGLAPQQLICYAVCGLALVAVGLGLLVR